MGPRGRLVPFPPPPPHDGGAHPFAWLFVIGVIVLVGIVVYYAIRYANRGLVAPAAAVPGASTPAQNALAVVALRYARGEIGREEYLQLAAYLGGTAAPAAEPSPPAMA